MCFLNWQNIKQSLLPKLINYVSSDFQRELFKIERKQVQFLYYDCGLKDFSKY